MSYSVVSLNEIADINPKTHIDHLYDDSLVTVLPMSSVSEEGIITEHQSSTISNIKKGLTLFKENDVLLAKITPCMENGKRAVAKGLQNGIGFGSTEFHVIRTKQEALPEFIYYFISQNRFRKEAELNMTGSAGQKRVPTSYLKTVKVILPPIEEQKKIVSALAEADALIKKRKEAIAKLDGLVESVFFEMFGDPAFNEKKWKQKTLKEISMHFSDGPFGSNLKSEHYQPDGVRVIRLQNIGIGEFVDKDKAYISEEHYKTIIKHSCYPGEMLLGTIGTPNLRACILPDSIEVAINKADCIRCKPNEKYVLAEYLCHLINNSQFQIMIQNLIHGQTRSRISMGQLSGFHIPVPPIGLQESFRELAQSIETQKQKMKEQLIKLEENFQSLLQQAFTGRLHFRDSKVDGYALKR